MVGKRRSVLNTKTPTQDLLYDQIKNLPGKHRSYICFLYLFGTRCREPLGLRDPQNRKKWLVEPMKVDDLVLHTTERIEGEGDKAVVVRETMLFARNMPVFKRENRPLMNKYVYVNSLEKPFVDLLMDYVAGKSKGSPIWTFSRYTAWRIVKNSTGLYPHALRGMRATKDATTYDLDLPALQRKFGWTQVKMPLHYVSMKETDIIQKLKRVS